MTVYPVLKVGSKGSDVKKWQAICGATPDGDFGPNTASKTNQWKKFQGLEPNGVVDQLTWEVALGTGKTEIPPPPPGVSYPFIQAKNFTKGRRGTPQVLVVHTMEAPEKTGTAMAVAKWFAGTSAPRASAHYCIDATEIIQCVKDEDTAWHAQGANHNGIGLEHAGYAKQTSTDWSDDFSLKMLVLSSKLAAALCVKWSIKPVRLTPSDLKAGKSGICGHIDCTTAFAGSSGHTDPGLNFPWSSYILMISNEIKVIKDGHA